MENRMFYQKLAQTVREGKGEIGLYTVISGEKTGQKLMVSSGQPLLQDGDMGAFWRSLPHSSDFSGAPCSAEISGEQVMAEHLLRSPRLVICGAGHISQPLAQIGTLLDFEVIVIDDREEFASAERFPGARRIICDDYADALAQLEENPNTYYVIVTRGHSADRECLKAALDRTSAYIGMIGSKTKVGVVMRQMLSEGYAKERLEDVYAPIGLKIGAQTPAEIAVCIAAELVQVRKEQAAEGCIEEKMLDLLIHAQQPMVMATVVSKEGSAPRGMGAKMLMNGQGEILSGSTGGGAGEAQVCALAAKVLVQGKPMLETCAMTNTDAMQAGMVCGGTITVLLDPIL